jgi:hypothetical protein
MALQRRGDGFEITPARPPGYDRPWARRRDAGQRRARAAPYALSLCAGAQYAISPWVTVGFDYLYGIYGTNEQGGVASFRSVFNPGAGGLQVFTGNGLLLSPQNLTTQTARFVINFKLD